MNISSYLSDLASRFGGSHSLPVDTIDRRLTFFDMQLLKPPGDGGVYMVLGYVDGYQIFHESRELASCRNLDAVSVMCLLPVRSGAVGPRNIAITYKSSPSVVRFIDITTGDMYHMIRLTSPVIGLRANKVCLAVQMEGKVGVYDIETLQDTFSVEVGSYAQTNSGASVPVLALGDRWVAYNLPPQMSSPSWSKSSGVWNTITSLGQDAIDNIVLAVYKQNGAISSANPDTIASPKSNPVGGCKNTRTGIVAIKDVLTQRIMGCVEDKESNRPIEWLEWSPCGTLLVTAIANGHWCKVYRVGGRGNVEFHLAYSLNRGVTPAVITSISVSLNLDCVSIASAKGTVHVFELTKQDECTVVTAKERIKLSNCEPTSAIPSSEETTSGMNSSIKTLFNTNGDILVFHNASGCVQRYKAADDGVRSVVDSVPVVRPYTVEESGTKDVLFKPHQSAADVVPLVSPPTLQTCRLTQNRIRSPLVDWYTSDGSSWCNGDHGCPQQLGAGILKALHTDLRDPAQDQQDAAEKYNPVATKDGFIQVGG